MANLNSYEESRLTESLNQFWSNFGRKFPLLERPLAPTSDSKRDTLWQDLIQCENNTDLLVDFEKEELFLSCPNENYVEDLFSFSNVSEDLSSSASSLEFEQHENYRDDFTVRTGTVCVVDGTAVKDVPGIYTIRGLLPHELPVIGTYIHPRIVPGFSYCVRPVNSSLPYFEGKALCLQRIGMGYGKRITFSGESLNENDNYFWSDTNPEGFGFSIQLVNVKDKFTVQNANKDPIAVIEVDHIVAPQIEIGHEILPKHKIEKSAKVFLQCSIQVFDETKPSHETVLVSGIAVALKDQKSRFPASVIKVKDCVIDGRKGYTLVPASEKVVRSKTVSGASINDIPACYTIKGLQDHELPVIGTYVDPRITSGFKYKVRLANSTTQLFEGEALTLTTIGRGYGKRLTFSTPSLNVNDNYFWSDTNPQGYGFSLEVVSQGDLFSIQDNSGMVVGKAVVYQADAPQIEIESFTSCPENVYTKKIRVSIVCHLSLYGESECTTHVTGVAFVERRGRKASVRKIENIAIGSHINILLSNGGESLRFIRE